MNCPNCKHSNPESARFCAQCGTALAQKQKTVFCSQCGEANKSTNQFCVVCGEKLIKGEQKRSNGNSASGRRNNQNNRKSVHQTAGFFTFGKTLTVSVVVVIAAIFVIKGLQPNEPHDNRVNMTAGSNFDPFLETQVIGVAAKFFCSCGGCNEDSLDDCTCDTATDEKQFIRQLLKEGKAQREAVIAVKQKYGFLKPAFEDEYGSL